MSKKVLIIGGVAGGASAAARLRRLDEQAEIILFERGEYISFANCGLPYYIGGVIEDREDLMVQTPESMHARFNLDIRIFSEVTRVDPTAKTVTVQSRDRGEYVESFDYLIVSPGAKPIRPNIPGINHPRILSLRNIPDTDAIASILAGGNVRKTVVIGGGFIGVEMAENLRERGLQVSIAEAAPHIMAPFDSEMSILLEDELRKNGIELALGDGVQAFSEEGDGLTVHLSSGKALKADLVILAIGVTPDTAFLKDSGIELGPRGHIVVNSHMQTNMDGVYAVGDAIEVVDYVTKQKTAIPLAGPANKQGRIAADNIAGIASTYKGSQGTSIIKIFDLVGASTGANERTLQRLNIPYKTVLLHPNSHATYYPGAIAMTLKLVFNEEGKVLGAQAVGMDGVDKRMDVLATVIRMNGTVEDLTELELAYAPPFSSAKDPVNMAGYLAQNVLAGRAHTITWSEVAGMNPEEYTLLDVRTEEEFQEGNVPSALNIPVDELRNRSDELDKGKKVVLYCRVGIRGYIADRILTQKGFEVLNITGGYLSAPGVKRED